MKFRQITIVLLGLFLSIIVIGCNTGTIRDYSYDEYENINAWTLSNDSSELSMNNYIVFDGGHSIQIINGGCGDLTLKDSLNDYLAFTAGQGYEFSVTVRRSPTDYDEDAPVDPVEDEDSILRGDNFSVILNQRGAIGMHEEAVIEGDFTWETKTFTYWPQGDGDTDVTLSFRLGCDLEMFWIDNIKISIIEPEVTPDES